MPKPVSAELVLFDDKQLVRCEIDFANAKNDTITALIDMGRALANAHEVLAGMGREGKFSSWLSERCDCSKTQAERLIKAHRLLDGKAVTGHFSHRAIEYLYKPDVPDDITEQAIALAKKGTPITLPLVKSLSDPQVVSPDEATTSESTPHVGHFSPEEGGDETTASDWVEEAAAEEPEEEPTIEEIVAAHNKAIESFCQSVRNLAKTKPKDIEWLDHKGRWDGYFRKVCQGLDTLRSAKAVVCPACEGETCDKCDSFGYLPKMEAESIQ